jgi:peptidoglycan hydrolase-like protein with peptidoglycan-binding domain
MITKGDQVSGWQEMLNQAGYSPGAVDGVFGPNTTSATQEFQKANGIPATGTVNAQTYEAMKARLSGRTLPTVGIKGFFGGIDKRVLFGSAALILLYGVKAFQDHRKGKEN